MTEEHHMTAGFESTKPTEVPVETTDGGVFDFLGKKKEEEKPEKKTIASEFEKVKASESEEKKEEEEKKLTPHRQSHIISSSTDEEEEEDGEKKKKKGLTEKIKENISGEKEEEKKVEHEDTSIPIKKCDEVTHAEATDHPEERNGFLGNIKEKIPGHQKKVEEGTPVISTPAPVSTSPVKSAPSDAHHEGEAKEKKGIIEKIKEKLPGHQKNEEEKEKEIGTH